MDGLIQASRSSHGISDISAATVLSHGLSYRTIDPTTSAPMSRKSTMFPDDFPGDSSAKSNTKKKMDINNKNMEANKNVETTAKTQTDAEDAKENMETNAKTQTDAEDATENHQPATSRNSEYIKRPAKPTKGHLRKVSEQFTNFVNAHSPSVSRGEDEEHSFHKHESSIKKEIRFTVAEKRCPSPASLTPRSEAGNVSSRSRSRSSRGMCVVFGSLIIEKDSSDEFEVVSTEAPAGSVREIEISEEP